MAVTQRPRPPREPWLMVRRDLSAARRGVLMLCSFVLPIALWCLVTYVPAFHRDYQLLIASARSDPTLATMVVGNRVSKDYFATYVEEARRFNDALRARRDADPDTFEPYRVNLNRLRAIEPLAVSNGFLSEVDRNDRAAMDTALWAVWQQIAEGRLVPSRPALSDENLAIVRENWAIMADQPADKRITTPLLNLLPQGRSASPVYLPAPHECFKAMWSDFTRQPPGGQPWMHQRLLSSLRVVFGGFLMACAVGVPLGVLCGSYDLFSKLFEPFTDFFRYMPAPTFSLLLVAAFGVEGAPKIALVFIGTFPHMVLMIANTTRLLDRNLLEAAQTLGASRGSLLWTVVIPGILPKLYSDLRVLLGWAWTWLVIAELIGTKTGLTGFIDTQGTRRNFDRVFPVIIMIGIIGFTTDQLLQRIARRLFPWEHTEHRPGMIATLRRVLVLRRTRLANPAGAADAAA